HVRDVVARTKIQNGVPWNGVPGRGWSEPDGTDSQNTCSRAARLSAGPQPLSLTTRLLGMNEEEHGTSAVDAEPSERGAMSEGDEQSKQHAPTLGERYSEGVVDLLGVLAYGELSAFDRLAEDARQAPTLNGHAALARMAAAEIGHYRMLDDHLA